MKLSGSYQINLPKEKVWEALNDPEILKQAIPGCEEFTKNSETEFTAVNSVSEFFVNSSHPGIACFNISGSFNASQTFSFGKFI